MMRCKVIPTSDDDDDILTLEECRAQCSVVPYDDDSDGATSHPDDTLLLAYRDAAIESAEAFTGLSIKLKTYEGALDEFPDDGEAIEIANPPLVEIESVLYGSDSETAAFTDFAVDDYSQPARIKPLAGAAWPTFDYALAGVRIRFQAGYTAATLPKALKQALLLTIGDWYEHREDSTAKAMTVLPNGAESLLRPLRVRLGMA